MSSSNTDHWLPLIEYSNKYKVSISTLRRRIKLESIPFKLDGGKYFIVDESPDELDRQSVSSPARSTVREIYSRRSNPEVDSHESSQAITRQNSQRPSESALEEPVLSAANRLLDELKKAYTMVLQEKDEQIRNLKEEISDLRTLVRVLENENARLTGGHHRTS